MQTRPFQVIQPVALREGVAQAIRKALVEGRFKPGQSLSDAALAKQMNVSRGPVREALLILAQQGLISHSQNHGFSVLGFDEQDHREIDEIRLKLESLALDLARARITKDDLKNLETFLKSTARLSRANPEWVKAEVEFHGMVWQFSRNRWLVSCLNHMMVPYFNYETAFGLHDESDAMDFAAQHRILLDYLRGKSPLTAEQCMRRHLKLPEGEKSEAAASASR